MSPSRKSKNPVRPTRLVKKAITGEGFRSIVYHISEPDLFFTINYHDKPEPYDWVVVSCPEQGELQIDLYDGQEFIGVVEILEFYQLAQSEQWCPRMRTRFTNW